MSVRVFILLGGLEGLDGYVDSTGMLLLAEDLKKLPGVTVATYPWSHWSEIGFSGPGKVALIGYSGGGSRATWLAAQRGVIDLLVAYDPSPKWQMKPLRENVKKAICYHNTNPEMYVPFIGSLGGGELTGIENIVTIDIAEQHLLVQANQELHAKTIAAVKELL